MFLWGPDVMTSRWGAGLRANRKSVGVLGPTHVCPHGGGGGGGGSGGGGGGHFPCTWYETSAIGNSFA